MWIFTEVGFFSVVAHRSKPGKVLVRGRVGSDLVEFAKRAGMAKSDVFEDRDADYRYRMEADSGAAAKVISEAMLDIDYDNFKARVEEVQGVEREQIYMGVWSHLNRSLR